MNNRIRQGLGLLVVSVISFIVNLVLIDVLSSMDVTLAYKILTLVQMAAAMMCILSLLVGLGLLAWGLLRPSRKAESTDD